MFNLEELQCIKEKFSNENLVDDTNNYNKTIAKKCQVLINKAQNCKEKLYSFYWDCGRQGEVEGLFKATEEEINRAIGQQVYFGEILGKHSEVYGTLDEGDITLVSDDSLIVSNSAESGYNPLNYVRFICSVCGERLSIEEFDDLENMICDYCAKEQDQ